MTNPMEQLQKDFDGLPEDDKVIIGYLTFGNSVWDIMCKVIEKMSPNEKAEILAAIEEVDNEDPGFRESMRSMYSNLRFTVNSPING